MTKAAGFSSRAEVGNKENPFEEALSLASLQRAVARNGPARFFRVVDLYGKLVKASRSALFIGSLIRGYILYVGSRIITMRALWRAAGGASSNGQSSNHSRNLRRVGTNQPTQIQAPTFMVQ